LNNRPRYRVNQYIRISEVELIDEFGKPRGVVSTFEALRMAQEAGLDLVEVNPSVKPPIAKIMNYGQFQYKQQKLAQAQRVKAKKIETKGVRLSLKIGEHDKEVRRRQAEKFLSEGHHVRLEMVLRGRERAYGDNARLIMEKFAHDFGEGIVIDVPFSRQGGRVSLQISRKKV
jgi:translation initiation factor IF-3